MKGALLALTSAGNVAAQLTFPAHAAVVAAINPSDPQYTACSAANDLLNYCVSSAGGTDAVVTADPTALLSCACCVSSTAISPAFSVCSTYLSQEAPSYSSQYSAYGDLYSLCAQNAKCGVANGGGGNTRFSTTPKTQTAASATRTASASATGTITGTSTAEQTYAVACQDMIGIFTSCTNKVSGFTDLPYKDQASCYCCKRNLNGQTTWTDLMDKYASTCASWAKTGEPETALSVAQKFETICEHFSDVCTASATDSSGAKTTGGSGGSGGSKSSAAGATVTVTPTPSATQKGAAVGLRIAVGTVVGAVVAFAIFV